MPRPIGYKLPEEMNKDESLSVLNNVLDVADRPAAALRSGAYDSLQGKSFLDGVQKVMDNRSDQLPSGQDIAELAGEKYDIQNPALLAGIATVGEMVDVPNPASLFKRFGKVANMVGKAGKAVDKTGDITKGMARVGDVSFPGQGSTSADLLVSRALKKQGTVPQGAPLIAAEKSVDFGSKVPLSPKREPISSLNTDEMYDVSDQFPNVLRQEPDVDLSSLTKPGLTEEADSFLRRSAREVQNNRFRGLKD